MKYWSVPVSEVVAHIETQVDDGLSAQEAQSRLERFGANEFAKPKLESVLSMVLRQLKDIANLILMLAAFLSLMLAIQEGHGYLEPAVIIIIITMNIILSVTQERSAEQALIALQNMNSPTCVVLRDGVAREVSSQEVVPGDVLVLKTGDMIPADARLLDAVGLLVDESSLTGESEPSEKDPNLELEDETLLADRGNCVFSGCLVTAGNGTAVVCATGMQTEMGKIAGYLNQTQRLQTPLQRRLTYVIHMVSAIAVVAAIIFFITGMQQGEYFWSMVLAAVSLAVAAVPETLQLIVTLTLTHGIKNMVGKHALIRKLPAVETLGSTSVICTDKTGTLTQNCMTIQRVWVRGTEASVDALELASASELKLIERLVLASSATIAHMSEDDTQEDIASEHTQAEGKDPRYPDILGDATEQAIFRLALDLGMNPDELKDSRVKVAEIPFSSARKMMTTIYELPQGGYLVLTKGAFDRLPFASASEDELKQRVAIHDSFAHNALRVIALGTRLIATLPEPDRLEEVEQNLTFEGIIGLIDPPRPEAREAVQLAQNAGVRTVMITGDHAATARAIAKQIGILKSGGTVITGKELHAMSDEDLIANIRAYSVFARVSPEDKIRIVEAWQEQGEVVAMTGDGVNDAPALSAADVGIAMGQTGTEVAKAAADMILTDDNFATIVEAVREGRNVFSNIKRTIYFLLACNLTEIAVMLIAQLLGWGVVLTPVMLLLINVLGDGIPGLHLAHDTSDERIMARKPIGRTESFFAGGIARAIGAMMIVMSLVGLLAFWIGAFLEIPGTFAPSFGVAQSMCFIVMAFTSVFHIFTVRSRNSIFKRSITDNMPMMYSVIGVSLAFSLMVLIEPLGSIFGLAQLDVIRLLISLGLALVPTVVAELLKLWDAANEAGAYRFRLVKHRRADDE